MDREALHRHIAEHQGNICGIVAMKGGDVLYSDCWHGFSLNDTVHVMSVTKSVVSLLIGIALDRGLIQSVRQKSLDFFPAYAVKRGEKTIQDVTIEHLLTMTAPWKYRSEPWSKVCSSEDWTATALDFLGGRAGLTGVFRYTTVCLHILNGILFAVSGLTTVDFANRFLFEPLGIPPHRSFVAADAEEHKHFTLTKAPQGDIWFSDPKGVATAGYGLCLSAIDMAKIGQLCLNGGAYEGKQIVSARWLEDSTNPRNPNVEAFGGMGYGYLWWTPEAGRRAYAALGNSGNVIYIDPEADAVVAVGGTFKPGILDRVSFIRSTIYPQMGIG